MKDVKCFHSCSSLEFWVWRENGGITDHYAKKLNWTKFSAKRTKEQYYEHSESLWNWKGNNPINCKTQIGSSDRQSLQFLDSSVVVRNKGDLLVLSHKTQMYRIVFYFLPGWISNHGKTYQEITRRLDFKIHSLWVIICVATI